ncbi:MAG: hypothetical protein K6E21_00175, partial [Bacilli bacterium]|nr:hypothetical protein [Bacilli bacterium]
FFVDNVLPEIENKTKIHIINKDPLKYGIELKNNDYNYIFVDIYNSAEEGIPTYLELKNKLSRIPYCQSFYYQEESIITLLEFEVTNALLKPSSNEISKKLTNYKFVNIYDYRKIFTFKSLLELYKK